MKIRAYPIVVRAVEEGIAYGITRMFKHDDRPLGEEALRERAYMLEDAVMNELCEVIEFEDEDLGVELEDPVVGASREINTEAGVHAQMSPLPVSNHGDQ